MNLDPWTKTGIIYFQDSRCLSRAYSLKHSLSTIKINHGSRTMQIVNNCFSCISPRISDQSSATHSDSLHTCTDNTLKQLNSMEILIIIQYNQMWPVNITGNMKGWLVNSAISTDMVCWPAVILIPALDSRMKTTTTTRFDFKFFFHILKK